MVSFIILGLSSQGCDTREHDPGRHCNDVSLHCDDNDATVFCRSGSGERSDILDGRLPWKGFMVKAVTRICRARMLCSFAYTEIVGPQRIGLQETKQLKAWVSR